MMKTAEIQVLFRQSDVLEFNKVMKDTNPIYESIEEARRNGFKTIPLPPTMPLVAYKKIKVPWTIKEPVIHRSQECIIHARMYIDEKYTAYIRIDKQVNRKNYCIVTQSLLLYDREQNLCFEGIYQIVCGGINENN